MLDGRVWVLEAAHARREGTAQEFVVVPVRHVAALPDHATFDLGACLGVPFLTAHRALTVNDPGPPRLHAGALDGRVVLVAGGAGAVANAAIQLAVWAGATVLTTVSGPAKAQLADAAGAHHVIDYRTSDVEDAVRQIAPHGADTIVEVAAGANAALDASLVARHGCVACYASEGEAEIRLPSRVLTGRNARWQFVSVFLVPPEAKSAAIEDVGAALHAGALDAGEHRGLPLHHYPLESTAEAHRAVEGSVVGKVLVDIAEIA